MSLRTDPSHQGNMREQAEQRMRQRDFAAAIELFDRHLAKERQDLRAMLEMGICHLLNGAEEPFRQIHRQASVLLSQARDLPADVARLWEQYNGLFRKVSS